MDGSAFRPPCHGIDLTTGEILILACRMSDPVRIVGLVAQGARAGLRELGRLLGVTDNGQEVAAACDARSHLADAIDAALRLWTLTLKTLAARLRITSQTATALLREERRPD